MWRKQDNDHNADKPRTQSDRPQVNTMMDETISIQKKPVQRLKKSFQDAKEVSSGHKRSQFRMQKKSVLNENKGGFHF
jgi:hypothetical protein